MSRIPVVAKLFVLTLGVLLVADACYAQQRGRGFGGLGAFGITKGQLVAIDQVQGELKLNDQQKSQVEQFVEDQRQGRGQRGGGGQDLSREERQERAAAAAKEVDSKLNAILNETQQKRLQEIYVQARGANALTDEAVASKLELTSEQKQKIGDIIAAEREVLTGLTSDLRDLPRDQIQGRFAEIQTKTQEINKETEKAAVSVLNDSQKEQWNQMKGEAFALDRSQLRGGFGGRGRRGNN